jgi:hypothetical protein
MANGVFRKTAAGRREIGQRGAGLSAAARQLLILVNGRNSAHALMAKGLSEVRAHLETLLAPRLSFLQPHFGPDTSTVAQALLAARSLATFREALGGLEANLAICMGRKQAAREVAALRNGT